MNKGKFICMNHALDFEEAEICDFENDAVSLKKVRVVCLYVPLCCVTPPPFYTIRKCQIF